MVVPGNLRTSPDQAIGNESQQAVDGACASEHGQVKCAELYEVA